MSEQFLLDHVPNVREKFLLDLARRYTSDFEKLYNGQLGQVLPKSTSTPMAFISRNPCLPARSVRFAEKNDIVELEDTSSEDSYVALLADDVTKDVKRRYLD